MSDDLLKKIPQISETDICVIEEAKKRLDDDARLRDLALIRDREHPDLCLLENKDVEWEKNAPDTSFFRIDEIKIHDHLGPDGIHDAIQGTMKKVLSAFNGLRSTLLFLVVGEESRVQIFLGVQGPVGSTERWEETLRSSIEGQYPGSVIKKVSQNELIGISSKIRNSVCSLLTGVPLVYHQSVRQKYCAEAIMRGLYGQKYGYLVIAQPVKDSDVLKIESQAINSIQLFQSKAKNVMTTSFSKNDGVASGLSKTLNASFQIAQTASLAFGGNTTITTGVSLPFTATVSVGGSITTAAATTVGGGIGLGVGHMSGNTNGHSHGNSVSYEQVNKCAESYSSRLGILLQRLESARYEGLWQTSVYSFAENATVLSQIEGLLRGTFSGDFGSFEPLRQIRAKKANNAAADLCLPRNRVPYNDALLSSLYTHAYATPLLTSELSVFFNLPGEDFPGYKIRRVPKFSVNPLLVSEQPIKFGSVCDREKAIKGLSLEIEQKELCRHALVSGITGSGKTNTVINILSQLGKTPFVVIEPSKNEYRELRNHKGIGRNLRVYTPGASVSPLYMNPFEIEAGSNLQSHIESLKAVLNNSFPMWGPLPAIIETCLYRLYEHHGWDIASSENKHAPDVFPRMEDFAREVEDYVKKSGYAQEVKDNIGAALNTRLRSLLVGSKKQLLNARKNWPLTSDLLSHPTVIELKTMGDDDDKSLIMGLLFMRFYQHLENKNRYNAAFHNNSLKNLIVIEEAHRLFRKTSAFGGGDVANIRAKSVEYFENVMSEIRAYGTGIVIVDQIPTRLAEGAVKNTNLKITHRLVSGDDISLIGNACALNTTEAPYIASLSAGRTLVHTEMMDKAINVEIDECKSACRPKEDELSDESIKELMQPILENSAFKNESSSSSIPQLFEKCDKGITDTANKHLMAILFSRLDRVRASAGIAYDIIKKETGSDQLKVKGVERDLLRIGIEKVVKEKKYLESQQPFFIKSINELIDSDYGDSEKLKIIQEKIKTIGSKTDLSGFAVNIQPSLLQKVQRFLNEAIIVFNSESMPAFNCDDFKKTLNALNEIVQKRFLFQPLEIDNQRNFTAAIFLGYLQSNRIPDDIKKNAWEYLSDYIERKI